LGAQHIEIACGYGESILTLLTSHDNRQKWLYCRPKTIASSWPKHAREVGMKIDEVIIYETSCNRDMETIEIADNGVLIFTSPSAIECFLVKYTFLPTHSIVVIGKTTQNALPPEVKSTLSEMITIESCIEIGKKLASRDTF
jgi:uroporphyrinogen-III synthase